MTEIYGWKWTKPFGHTPTEGWIACLHGLEPAMIKNGLSRMAHDRRYADWPPGALEFRNLCLRRGEDLGLPSDDEAYRQAIGASTEKHPAVIHTLRQIGQFEFRRMKESTAENVFRKAWGKTLEYVAAGGELPEPIREIEEQHSKANPETADTHLSQLKGLFQEGAA